MNVWQLCLQIQYLLQQAVWPSTSTPVFEAGSVLVLSSQDELEALDARPILPMCIIVPQSGGMDPEHQDEAGLIQRGIDIVLVTRNENDRLGQGAVVGANREGIADSRGRGVLELELMLLDTIKILGLGSGVSIQFSNVGPIAIRRDSEETSYAVQPYTFLAWVTSEQYYPGAARFRGAPRTGEVSMTWVLPSARFDRYRAVLRRATGSTPPTSITGGTGVTLAGSFSTSKVDTGLSAGTYSYALFVTYDDFSRSGMVAAPAQDLRSSESVTLSGLVVP